MQSVYHVVRSLLVPEVYTYEERIFNKWEYELLRGMVKKDVNLQLHARDKLLGKKFTIKLLLAVLITLVLYAAIAFISMRPFSWQLNMMQSLCVLVVLYSWLNIVIHAVTFAVAEAKKRRYIGKLVYAINHASCYEEFSLLLWGDKEMAAGSADEDV